MCSTKRTTPMPPVPRIDSTRYFPARTSPGWGTSFDVTVVSPTLRGVSAIQDVPRYLPLPCPTSAPLASEAQSPGGKRADHFSAPEPHGLHLQRMGKPDAEVLWIARY